MRLQAIDEKKAEEWMREVTQSMNCYTAKHVASLLKCSVAYVSKLISQRKLQAFYQGNSLRIPAWSISAYQNKQCSSFEVERKALDRSVERRDAVRARGVERMKRGLFEPSVIAPAPAGYLQSPVP